MERTKVRGCDQVGFNDTIANHQFLLLNHHHQQTTTTNNNIVMAKKKKWYAVAVGRIPGIYETWNECSAQVSFFPHAKHKSFPTRQEAETYLKLHPLPPPPSPPPPIKETTSTTTLPFNATTTTSRSPSPSKRVKTSHYFVNDDDDVQQQQHDAQENKALLDTTILPNENTELNNEMDHVDKNQPQSSQPSEPQNQFHRYSFPQPQSRGGGVRRLRLEYETDFKMNDDDDDDETVKALGRIAMSELSSSSSSSLSQAKMRITDVFQANLKRCMDQPPQTEGPFPPLPLPPQKGDVDRFALRHEILRSVQVGWPYPTMLPPQKQMVLRIVAALQAAQHVVLESPTGTGKSAAILCSTLAWARYHRQVTTTTSAVAAGGGGGERVKIMYVLES